MADRNAYKTYGEYLRAKAQEEKEKRMERDFARAAKAIKQEKPKQAGRNDRQAGQHDRPAGQNDLLDRLERHLNSRKWDESFNPAGNKGRPPAGIAASEAAKREKSIKEGLKSLHAVNLAAEEQVHRERDMRQGQKNAGEAKKPAGAPYTAANEIRPELPVKKKILDDLKLIGMGGAKYVLDPDEKEKALQSVRDALAKSQAKEGTGDKQPAGADVAGPLLSPGKMKEAAKTIQDMQDWKYKMENAPYNELYEIWSGKQAEADAVKAQPEYNHNAGTQGWAGAKQEKADEVWRNLLSKSTTEELKELLQADQSKYENFYNGAHGKISPSKSAADTYSAIGKRIDDLQYAIAAKEQQDKKDGIAQGAKGAPDFEEMKDKGAGVRFTLQDIKNPSDLTLHKIFNDKYKNILELVNEPQAKEYAKRISSMPNAPWFGAMLGGNLGKDLSTIPVSTNLKYAYIEDDEADVLRYLYAKGDYKGIDDYLGAIDSDLNKRQTEGDFDIYKKGAEQADPTGTAGKIGAGLMAVNKGFELPLAGIDSIIGSAKQNLTGKYEKPDPYSPWQRAAEEKQAAADYATEDLDPDMKENIKALIDLAGSAPYLFMGPTGKALSLLGSGGEAAHNGLKENDSYNKALAKGLHSVLPDLVLNAVLGKGGTFSEKVLNSAFKGAASESYAALAGTKKPPFEELRDQYMKEGMGKEEAEAQALEEINKRIQRSFVKGGAKGILSHFAK